MINGIFNYIKTFNFNLNSDSSNLKKLIIGDGIILAYTFIKDLFFFKLVTKKSKMHIKEPKKHNEMLNKYKESIINNYNEIYILSTIERYVLYFLISKCYYFARFINNSFIHYDIVNNIFEFVTYLFLTPSIQNYIAKNNTISKYRKNLLLQIKIFIKYYISKQIIVFVKNLYKDIYEIRTYNIFILYHYISYEFITTFIKSYCFVNLLYFFRNNDGGYYYYKAIKLACYYNYGLDFKIINVIQSCNIINELIYYKNWNDIVKVNNAHAIHVLVHNKYFLHNNYYDNYIAFIICISIWSFILLLKELSLSINIIILTSVSIYRYIYNTDNQTSINTNKNNFDIIYKCGLNICIGVLCKIYNINEIIGCILFILNDNIYNFIYDLLFYIKNKNNFKKAIEYYKKDNKSIEYKLSSLF